MPVRNPADKWHTHRGFGVELPVAFLPGADDIVRPAVAHDDPERDIVFLGDLVDDLLPAGLQFLPPRPGFFLKASRPLFPFNRLGLLPKAAVGPAYLGLERQTGLMDASPGL